jgi:hypothetical protein
VPSVVTLPRNEQALRLATALAHSAPGVTLRLTCANGERIAVGYGQLGPHLTPCQLRSALIAEPRQGMPRFADAVSGVELVSGLDHIGGGLYACGAGTAGTAGSQRWFATPLHHEQIVAITVDHPDDMPERFCAVNVLPDTELGVCTVRLVTTAEIAHRLDEIAFWLLSQCLVAELSMSVASSTHHRP